MEGKGIYLISLAIAVIIGLILGTIARRSEAKRQKNNGFDRNDDFQIDSLVVCYEDGRYRLIDNDTGESVVDKSLSRALSLLNKRIWDYKNQPEVAVEEKKKKAGKMIDDMSRDEFFMCAILPAFPTEL